jgi:uncharacterized protein (DUF2336 family)
MSASPSLIPELERVLQEGSPDRCAEMLAGITHLFLSGAGHFNEDHLALFDEVFARLIDEIETRARAELSARLALFLNAPPKLVRRLAGDDDISVAGPMLQHSPRLADGELRTIADSKGQAHLLAIAGRREISARVTDVLVQRGSRDVVCAVADNQGARISEWGFSTLVQRAAGDGGLAERVGQRVDIPPHLFRTLVTQATEVVRQRLLAKARPDTAPEIRRVVTQVSEDIRTGAPPARDYSQAKAAVQVLERDGRLAEPALADYAASGRYEEAVVMLAELTGVAIETVERLLAGERPDPVLILCKAAGFDWRTVRAIILVRPNGKNSSRQALNTTHADFERLSSATAQRVARFWQIHPGHAA